MKQQFIHEAVGDFLLRRLRELGIAHLFGVPGDFNLEFLEQLERTPQIAWIGCCNELNAAYAADGYARTRGLGAVLTTYGVGELSALCGVAGAFAEHVPLISIVGSPPLVHTQNHALLHHSAADGDFDNMYECGAKFSVAQTRLTPQNAAIEIDRCLIACLREQCPIYLQLPSGIASNVIRVPAAPIEISKDSDAVCLRRWSIEVNKALQSANKTVLLVDADVARHGASDQLVHLAERLGCSIAVMASAKGIVDENHPAYIGVYNGAYSKAEVCETVESADCLIQVAVRLTDATSGAFTQRFAAKTLISIDAWQARCGKEVFYGLHIADSLRAIAPQDFRLLKREAAQTLVLEPDPAPSEMITHAWFWKRVAKFLRRDDVIAAENGTSLSGMLSVTLPTGATFLSQSIWGSIGYTLPAIFGSLIGSPNRRHLLFIGDGSFQLTAQELSSILRHRLKPILFLINNGGYTIERLILGATRNYNDVHPWRYTELLNVFADGTPYRSFQVQTPTQLEEALAQGEAADCCVLIEVCTTQLDAPEALRTLGPVFARQDYGSNYLEEYPQP